MFKVATVFILLVLAFSNAFPQNQLRSRGNRVSDVRFRERQVVRAREGQNMLADGLIRQDGARGRANGNEQRRQELEEQSEGELPEAEAEQNVDEGEQSASGEVNEQGEQGEEQSREGEQQNEQRDESAEDKKQHMPNYEFAYGVYDPVTGDHKDQWEKRVGGHVKGFYSFDQPDGKKRLVEYEGDSKHGFHASVSEIKQEEAKQEDNSKKESDNKINKIAHSYTKVKIIH